MTTASATSENATASASPRLCECFGDSGLCGSTHRQDATGPACCDLCGLPVQTGSSDGLKIVNPSADLGDLHGTVPSAADVSDIEKPYAAFGTAEWFVIIARGGLAFRFGPYDGPAVGKIMSQCQDENIACLVTGNCRPEFDWELARDFCQKVPAPAQAQPESGAA